MFAEAIETPEQAWQLARRLEPTSRLTVQELFVRLAAHLEPSTMPFAETELAPPADRSTEWMIDVSWSPVSCSAGD